MTKEPASATEPESVEGKHGCASDGDDQNQVEDNGQVEVEDDSEDEDEGEDEEVIAFKRDGVVVLRHVEESGFGAVEKTVAMLRGKYVVLDELDDTIIGSYRSLESAIVKNNLFEVGLASTEIWCSSLSVAEIVSKLSLFEYRPEEEGFLSVNGSEVTREQIFKQRHVDNSEVILKRLQKNLRSAIRSGKAERLSPSLPPRSQNEALAQMYARGRSANLASELSRILRDVKGASAAEAIFTLEQADETRQWNDVVDLREALLREATSSGGPTVSAPTMST